MAEYTGQAMYLQFGATALNADYRSFKVTDTLDEVEASAGSDTHKSAVGTLVGGSANLSMVAQTGGAGTDMWAALPLGGTGTTLTWAPEGTATGKQKHTCTAHIKNRDITYPYAGLVEFTIDFTLDTTPVDSVY